MYEVKDKLNVSTKWMILLFVLITFTACSTKKKVEVMNKDGKVIESYFVEKKHPEIKTGLYQKYYDDGKLLETSTFVDGKLQGERTLYYPNGNIMQQEHYKDNTFEGKFTAYFENGSLQQEGNYKDNMMDGLWKNYSKENKNMLQNEITLKENKINGLYKEYYPNGKLYAEGNKIELFDDMDVYDGKVNVYDTLGNLEKIITFERGKQINKEEK